VAHPVAGAGVERTIGFFVERPDLRQLEVILAPIPGDPRLRSGCSTLRAVS